MREYALRTNYFINEPRYLQSRYQEAQQKSSLRKVYGRYNDIVSQNNVSLRDMLTTVFHTCYVFFYTPDGQRFLPFFITLTTSTRWLWPVAEDAYSSQVPDPNTIFLEVRVSLLWIFEIVGGLLLSFFIIGVSGNKISRKSNVSQYNVEWIFKNKFLLSLENNTVHTC